MANHSLKEAEQNKEAQKKIVKGTAWGALAWMAGKAIVNGIKEEKEKEQLRNRAKELKDEINRVNDEIEAYEGKLFGSWLYSDEINSLKKERAKYQEELNEILRKLA